MIEMRQAVRRDSRMKVGLTKTTRKSTEGNAADPERVEMSQMNRRKGERKPGGFDFVRIGSKNAV